MSSAIMRPSSESPKLSSSSNNISNLVPPPLSFTKEQRRMSSPAPLASVDLSDSSRQQEARPPSPLRNSFSADTSTGIYARPEDDVDDEDDEGWDRTSSPTPSLTQFASNIAQRVGSLVSNMSPRATVSPFPTDAELEAEAERERERSRREAERIIMQEAAERRRVEERMRELLADSRISPSDSPLPPLPPRSQSTPNPPSPSPSQREGGSSWWAAAKSKLTPSKEPLTPAQQIVQETKAREKEEKKKGKGKEKDKEIGYDPSLLNLNIPRTPQNQPASLSPHSPTSSSNNLPSVPAPLNSSPMRSMDNLSSSSRDPMPHYAQFNAQGTLDIPGTLLVIARRFEKLEKWTVGHVRALEERMSDVERWLVDKEKEKEKEESLGAGEQQPSQAGVNTEVNEMREEILELQGRVVELGREMARLATAPANLSSGPNRPPASIMVVPQSTSSSMTVRAQTPTRPSGTAKESSSPPMAPMNSGSRSRLPYPSGDYATPPDTALLSQGVFSPTSSPPSSLNSVNRSRPMSISGLPTSNTAAGRVGLGITAPGLPQASSASMSNLPAPTPAAPRASSVSPTPRKRYTVALGGPIVAPDERPLSLHPSPSGSLATSSSPVGEGDNSDNVVEEDNFQDTIGKTLGTKLGSENGTNENVRYSASPSPSPSRSYAPSPNRIRAQSAYGLSSIAALSPTTPLRPHLRSKSTERLAGMPNTALGSKFVDPLALRKQERTGANVNAKVIPGKGKVAVGQLVAFFDREK